jgi:hypothetical protein
MPPRHDKYHGIKFLAVWTAIFAGNAGIWYLIWNGLDGDLTD